MANHDVNHSECDQLAKRKFKQSLKQKSFHVANRWLCEYWHVHVFRGGVFKFNRAEYSGIKRYICFMEKHHNSPQDNHNFQIVCRHLMTFRLHYI